MPDFAPDDRDEDEGWDSYEEYLRERDEDMEYPDTAPDGVDLNTVHLDRLDGVPDDAEIEIVDREGNGIVSGKAQHE